MIFIENFKSTNIFILNIYLSLAFEFRMTRKELTSLTISSTLPGQTKVSQTTPLLYWVFVVKCEHSTLLPGIVLLYSSTAGKKTYKRCRLMDISFPKSLMLRLWILWWLFHLLLLMMNVLATMTAMIVFFPGFSHFKQGRRFWSNVAKVLF